jgi:hypothetical protein
LVVVGVALRAAPSGAQVWDFFARYVADSAAPGEGNTALRNGYELCPPNDPACTKYSQAHHHIDVTGAGAYNTDVLDVHNCNTVTVCAKTSDNDGTTAEYYIESVVNNTGAEGTYILADINGDGVINATDLVTMDGDRGTDNDGDGTPRQTACMYGIVGHNKIRLAVQQDGGDDDTYVEVNCR